MKKGIEFIKKQRNICILGCAILAVILLGGYIYLNKSHKPDDQDATDKQQREAVQAVKDEDYDKLMDMYETADALIDTLDLSDDDKDKKHNALKAYGDAIASGDMSDSQATEFADLVADIEEVANSSSTENSAGASVSDTNGGSTTEDKTTKYDEAYLDRSGTMHYTKKLSAEEFYNYEIRFKGVDKSTAKKTMEENIASGWTEIYVPVDENGNYINE